MTAAPVSATGVVHGEILTRRWVAEMMLDLAAYLPERDLTTLTVVEPAAGPGAFVGVIVDRLIESATRHAVPLTVEALGGAVQAFDIQPANVTALRRLVEQRLVTAGSPDAAVLAAHWVRLGDYLLADHRPADLVIGNPPYVRYDDLDPATREAYRARWKTMGGRGDIFVGFFEAGLRQLKPDGLHVFICADRWMRNDYGKQLRNLITTGGFAVDAILTCHDADVFEQPVSAYPAVTVLRRGSQGPVVVANAAAQFGQDQTRDLLQAARTRAHLSEETFTVGTVHDWPYTGKSGWPAGDPALLEWLDTLNGLPTIEETGARIGIGIATGCDAAYVIKPGHLPPPIEPDRLLPLAHADDIRGGRWQPRGFHLVNPWNEEGAVDIHAYPQMRDYLQTHPVVQERNIAKRYPDSWWRTIDRVNYRLLDRSLILLQDMKANVTPVVAPAGFYPHHNLYWIDVNGSGWQPEALAGLLMSDQVQAQIAARCVLMRGGTLRMQAQYLRQVHIPKPADLTDAEHEQLAVAYQQSDRAAATHAMTRLLGENPTRSGQ